VTAQVQPDKPINKGLRLRAVTDDDQFPTNLRKARKHRNGKTFAELSSEGEKRDAYRVLGRHECWAVSGKIIRTGGSLRASGNDFENEELQGALKKTKSV
jgi:hypothetical protein